MGLKPGLKQASCSARTHARVSNGLAACRSSPCLLLLSPRRQEEQPLTAWLVHECTAGSEEPVRVRPRIQMKS